MLIDEVNPEPDTEAQRNLPEHRFLIVGCVIFDSERVLSFNDAVDEIREKHGFQGADSLKFSIADKPAHVSNEQHRSAKEELIAAACDHDAKVIFWCASHKIIDSQGKETYLDWSIDALLTKVQQYCAEDAEGSPFICLVDRHSRKSFGRHLQSKFMNRNAQPKQGFNTPLLAAVGAVWDQTSHLASICDVVIGSYSYIVHNPHRDIAGQSLIKCLKPLIWKRKQGKLNKVTGFGLLFRPEIESIRHDGYRAAYEELRQRVIDWANKKRGDEA